MLNPKPMSKNELADFLAGGEPSDLEFFKANIEDGFANTSVGVALEAFKENFNAIPEERASKEQAQENIRAFYEKREAKVVDPSSPQLTKYSVAQWKESEFFRPGINFQEGWSEERAKYMAESFDERKERELMMTNPDGLLSKRGGIGMIGQIVGSLPDPINYIPFGGQASKGAKVAEKLARGAVEGAVGNLAVAAVARPFYEERGTEATYQDYLNDLWIGGVMGGGFAGLGHSYSKIKERRANVGLNERATLAKAGDAAIEANLRGEDLDLSQVPDLQKTFDSVFDIPEVQRSRRVQDLQEQLIDLGYSADDAKVQITPLVAHAEAFARDFDMSVDDFMDKYGATFQKSEMVDGKILSPEQAEVSTKVNEFLDSELQTMAKEIEFAEKGGQKIFDDGKYVSTTGEGSYPEWYAQAGVKNKEHLSRVINQKKGPVYERLLAIAEERLINGYETPTSRAAPSNEFLSLIGKDQVDIPLGADGLPLFQYAGPTAKTAPLDKLNEARLLERDGAKIDAIREKTGWFKAQDGKWRFEIDDSKAKFKSIDVNKKKKYKLAEVLDHSELFEAYPQLKDVNIEFAAFQGRKGGHFNERSNTIKVMVRQDVKYPHSYEKAVDRVKELKLTPEYEKLQAARAVRDFAKYREILNDTEFGREYQLTIAEVLTTKPKKSYPRDLNIEQEALNTILHEVQHSIQSVEGFARGGNKIQDGGFNNYQRLHGEIEARDVEARKSLTPEERKVKTPATLEAEQAIVKWRGEEMVQVLPDLVDPSTPKGDIFDATPQTLLQKKYNKGNGTDARGAITLGDEGKSIIHLFENADQSTIIHETGHLFLNNLERFSKLENAPASIKNDLAVMRKWMGVPEGGKIEVKHHEKFARGFEQFLREGKAPRAELQSAFSRFRDWLKSLYSSSKDLKANLSDEAREVYSRLLGSESRPRIDSQAEIKAPEPVFKDEAEVMAKTSEIQSMVETNPGIAHPDEVSAFQESIAEIEAETSAMDEVLTFFQGAKDEKALQEAASKVGISKSQFERIIDDFNEKLLKEDEARLGIEKLIEKRKNELAAEAAELKRQSYLSLSARSEVLNHVKTVMNAGGSAKDSVLSILEGASHLRGIEGAGKSVDGTYMALAQTTSAKVFTALRKVDPKIEKLFENDIQFNQSVIKEMISPGSTGDDVAKQAGEILSKTSNELRERANLAGASIGKLEGHVPRTHDVEKMVGRMDEWISFMSENLDPDRSFQGLNEGGKREALAEVYASLVSDNHGTKEVDLTEPLRRVPRNIAKSMGESRSLHFKSPEAELAYLKEFGQGDNILEAMASHFEGMSKKIAMMERLGPNPENTIAHVVQKLNDDIKADILSKKIDSKEAEKKLAELGNVNKLKSRDSAIGQAMMHALGETDSTQGWFKSMSRVIRGVNSLSKLGSALLSQPTDFVHAVNERRIITNKSEARIWVETLKDYFSSPDKELQDVMDHVGIFVDAFNYKNFNRFDADNINNKLGRANDWMFRWSGQNWHVKNTKKAAALSLAREMGNNISKSWNDMHPGLRETLIQYGSFNEAKWQMLQKAKAIDVDGKAYYHPGMINEIPDEAFEHLIPQDVQNISRPTELPVDGSEAKPDKAWEKKRSDEIKRARFKLEMDLKTFFVEESRNAAPEPDAKVRRVMAFKTKSGSSTNEALKLITQFKTFAFVNWDRSMKGKRMMRNSSDYGGVAHHAVATLALGYFSTILKDLAKGVEPADPTQLASWGRAAAQSGGLGIMGDFFGSAYSARSGSDVISTFAGPTLSTLSNASVLALKGVHGETYEDGSKYASKWVDLARTVAPAPFSTLWYTRAAMDQLIWQNLKETLEPGSIRRSERRLKKEYNQKYIVSPRSTQWLPQLTR